MGRSCCGSFGGQRRRGRARAPGSSPRPEGAPTRGRSAAARGLGVGAERARASAPYSGITSPCSAQSSRVAESRVVRSSAARTCGVDLVGVATPAARWTREPAAQHVVADGVSPSPRPTRSAATSASSRRGPRRRRARPPGRGDGRAVTGLAVVPDRRVRRGVRTSHDRPTVSGLPSCERPPRRTPGETRASAVESPAPQRAGHRGGAGGRPRRRTGRRPRRRPRRGPRCTTGTGPSAADRSRSRTRARPLTGRVTSFPTLVGARYGLPM